MSSKKKYKSSVSPLLFIFAIIGTQLAISYGSVRHKTITITDKERVQYSNGNGSQYLVWTEENGTLTVKDSLLQGKFRASDTYGSLKIGQTYNVRINGYRFGLFSWYSNILDVTSTNSSDKIKQ